MTFGNYWFLDVLMWRILHYWEVPLKKWPLFTIIFFILITFLPVVFLYCLDTFVQKSIVDRRNLFDYVSIYNLWLSIDSSDQLKHLKSIDNGMTGFRLDLQTIIKPFNNKLVNLIEKNVSSKKGCLKFLFLLFSLTLKADVNIFNLHHDILLDFWKTIKLLIALLCCNTFDIAQKMDRVGIFISGIG